MAFFLDIFITLIPRKSKIIIASTIIFVILSSMFELLLFKARLSIQQIPETVLTCDVQKLLLSILQQPEAEGRNRFSLLFMFSFKVIHSMCRTIVSST